MDDLIEFLGGAGDAIEALFEVGTAAAESLGGGRDDDETEEGA